MCSVHVSIVDNRGIAVYNCLQYERWEDVYNDKRMLPIKALRYIICTVDGSIYEKKNPNPQQFATKGVSPVFCSIWCPE